VGRHVLYQSLLQRLVGGILGLLEHLEGLD
jgi:hypothetical protein